MDDELHIGNRVTFWSSLGSADGATGSSCEGYVLGCDYEQALVIHCKLHRLHRHYVKERISRSQIVKIEDSEVEELLTHASDIVRDLGSFLLRARFPNKENLETRARFII